MNYQIKSIEIDRSFAQFIDEETFYKLLKKNDNTNLDKYMKMALKFR